MPLRHTQFLKTETLSISMKAQPCSGARCTAEGTSGHKKEQGKRKPARSNGRIEPSGCPEDQICLLPLPALQEVCCGVYSCFAGGCPRRRPADGDASPRLERCPCESAGEAGLEEPCARPTASLGCDPNHRRRRIIPLGDSRRIAEALLPLLASSTYALLNRKQRESVRGKSAFL